MTNRVGEVVWLRWLLHELGVSSSGPTPLHRDNQAASRISANPVFHERTKHVEIDYHFIRERIASLEIVPRKISTQDQMADLFTKGLDEERFAFLRSKLGMYDIHAFA
ncbi:unnamed protein product [Linum trigynum]|uniref:Uncharacterized protein n=1 Tax=Linum trigynum TaxID=586398 RepID=A0AAV2D9X8_9ROSI